MSLISLSSARTFSLSLNAVLKGPARSWWLAARSKISNWLMFEKAFLGAFLPSVKN